MHSLNFVIPLLALLHCMRSYTCFIKRVGITVLYEALCPDSQSFFYHFLPVFLDYERYLNVNLIPYGKAVPVARGHQCQHGKSECWGNMMMDCGVHTSLTQIQKMKFVSCQMRNFQLTKNRKFICAKAFKIYKSVKYCMKHSNIGKKLQKNSSIITKRYSFSEIPAIVYNGVYNESLQYPSRMNVRQTICKMLVTTKHVLPKDC